MLQFLHANKKHASWRTEDIKSPRNTKLCCTTFYAFVKHLYIRFLVAIDSFKINVLHGANYFIPKVLSHHIYLLLQIIKFKIMDFVLNYIPSGYEIVIILVVVVLLFGGKKIPELMRGLGSGMKEFKKATSGVDDVKKEIDKTASDVNKKDHKKEDSEKEDDRNKS